MMKGRFLELSEKSLFLNGLVVICICLFNLTLQQHRGSNGQRYIALLHDLM